MIKILFLIASSIQTDMPKDSIGVETVNGKTFVIHRVDEKETLFAISRRYRSTVDAILQYNASAKDGLEIGQILRVPYTPRTVAKPGDGIVHKVEAKETLYSISRLYEVSMDDLKRWNNLNDSDLAIGQELIIRKTATAPVQRPQPILHEQPQTLAQKGVHTVEQGQTLFSIARQYQVSVDQLREWNSLTGNELRIGQTLYVAQPERLASAADRTVTVERPQPAERTVQPTTPVTPPATTPSPVENSASSKKPSSPTGQSAESIRISESLKSGDEIVEGGLAELIEGTDGNRKYLALHRTAPMGTILKVRNEMNNREVFVRVMGKLPDTAMTDKLIIKISKSAYDRLGAIDPRFRVEVTYYK